MVPFWRVGLAVPEDSPAIARLLSMIMAQHGWPVNTERVAETIRHVFAHPEQARFVVAYRGDPGSRAHSGRGCASAVSRSPAPDDQPAASSRYVGGMLTLVLAYSTWDGAPIASVDDLIVDPAERGQGLATKLLAWAADYGRAQGWSRLELNVELNNATARRLYQRFGFTRQTRALYVYSLR